MKILPSLQGFEFEALMWGHRHLAQASRQALVCGGEVDGSSWWASQQALPCGGEEHGGTIEILEVLGSA